MCNLGGRKKLFFADWMSADVLEPQRRGVAKTGVKVSMLTECIGRRFPDKKVQKMRSDLKALGVNYV